MRAVCVSCSTVAIERSASAASDSQVRSTCWIGRGRTSTSERVERDDPRSATSTPATITSPPVASAALGRWSRSTAAESIATTGARSTHGTTAADGLR